MTIPIFFLIHWFLSLFSQTFFLHRYAAHKMFTMNKFWERFFYLFTFITQGSSFLNPRAYAVMHRMHHAYSDTEKDPHSPHYFKSMFRMMSRTYDIYIDILLRKISPGENFEKVSRNGLCWTGSLPPGFRGCYGESDTQHSI